MKDKIFTRRRNRVLGEKFTEAYCNGKINFGSYRTPEVFADLVDTLNNYNLTNSLENNSCLIIPESSQIVDVVLKRNTPKVFIDSHISEDRIKALSQKGEMIKNEYNDLGYYTSIAKQLASNSDPLVFIVNLFRWDSTYLQKGLIAGNKHYAIALPEIIDEALPSYNDPNRWKRKII